MRLHQQLEKTFKLRCNSNDEIIPYIKKLSEMGKFDEPKKVAILAIILDRLGKMEDETHVSDPLDIPVIESSSQEDNMSTSQQGNYPLTAGRR